jgi:16S rRNA U1498 N3-methylase RsmE
MSFIVWNKYVNFNRNQIQEKEDQLKRDYKMLKEARKQSGSTWNERRCMVEGSSSMWNNLEIVSQFLEYYIIVLFHALG